MITIKNKKSMETRIEKITPQRAEELLKTNSNNRPISKPQVDYLAMQMERGDWKLNGETIKISKDGILQDGQHRLQACVQSGKSFDTFVIYGLENDSILTIDTGKKRGVSDTLTIKGIKNATKVSSIMSYYYTLKEKRGVSSDNKGGTYGMSCAKLKKTNKDYIEFFKQYTDTIEDVQRKASCIYNSKRLLSTSEIGGYMLYFILEYGYSIESVSTFFEQLAGNETPSTLTITRLQNILIKRLQGYTLLATIKKRYILIAFNSFVQKKNLQLVYDNEVKDYKIVNYLF